MKTKYSFRNLFFYSLLFLLIGCSKTVFITALGSVDKLIYFNIYEDRNNPRNIGVNLKNISFAVEEKVNEKFIILWEFHGSGSIGVVKYGILPEGFILDTKPEKLKSNSKYYVFASGIDDTSVHTSLFFCTDNSGIVKDC